MKRNSLNIIIVFTLLVVFAACKKNADVVHRTFPQVTISAGDPRITASTIHFVKDTVYVLATDIVVDSGHSFTADAGTIVKVQDKRAIIIQAGAVINCVGTSSDPVIFTSSANEGTGGPVGIGASYGTDHYWKGITINGGSSASGTLSFVRIEFAGGNINSPSSSLYLHNVQQGTALQNIQVSYSYNSPSFEFDGGNVDAKKLLSYASSSSDFYFHNGYTGRLQFLLAYRNAYFPLQQNVAGDVTFAGFYITDQGSEPVISNATVLGPAQTVGVSRLYLDSATYYSGTPSGTRSSALVTTNSTRFHIRNSVFMGFPKTCWTLDDRNTAVDYSDSLSDFEYNIVQCDNISRTFFLPSTIVPPFTSVDFSNLALQSRFHNEVFADSAAFMFTSPFDYNGTPNPTITSGSPLQSGANFETRFADDFFEKVNFRGAQGSDNWLTGWTNFKPLQTAYNK